MEFTYITKASSRRMSESKEEEVYDDNFEQTFKSSDPFVSREQAFSYAKNYKDVFFEANRAGTDHFFKTKNEIHKDFTVSVMLINPENSEEIVIDNYEPFDLDGLMREIEDDPIRLQWTLKALEEELETLRKYNVSVIGKTKAIKVFYHQSQETKLIEIIPTEYLNKNQIEIKALL